MAKALLSTKQVENIDIKRFAKTILDKKIEVFIVYIASLNLK